MSGNRLTKLDHVLIWAILLFLFALVCLLLSPSSAEARDCPNLLCAMCAVRFGTPPGYVLVDGPGWGRVVKAIDSAAVISGNLQGSASTAVGSFSPTPHDAVEDMLDQLDLGPDDVLYDIGAGDARILIAAVERFGCRAVGIELNPETAALARRRVREAGCGRIRIVQGDARRFDLGAADGVCVYLFPDLMAELVSRIWCPIVSYSHEIPGRNCRKVVGRRGYPVWVARARVVNLRVM